MGNNEFENEILNLMKDYAMPYSIAGVGVDHSEETFEQYYTSICNSSAINKANTAECEKFKDSLYYFWNNNR